MHKLVSISNVYACIAPKLKWMSFYDCLSLKLFLEKKLVEMIELE